MKNIITIIDYGLNNIQSVIQAFNYIGVDTIVANSPTMLEKATHIVLPGVGAFPEGMKQIKNLGLDKIIKLKVKQKTKLIGICLGMQMLFTKSYEFSVCEGLNLIPGDVVPIQKKNSYHDRVPVIGWRKTISLKNDHSNILQNLIHNKSFYYLHSYQVIPEKNNNLVAYYNREEDVINAGVSYQNIWGVQFHPEKSGEIGLSILKAFSELSP